jgi:hypothetical protein
VTVGSPGPPTLSLTPASNPRVNKPMTVTEAGSTDKHSTPRVCRVQRKFVRCPDER